jgi:hypothetical protein
MNLAIGDFVTTLSGTIVLITRIGIIEQNTMRQSGTQTFNEGVVLSSGQSGFAICGADYHADSGEPLRVVANIRDVLRVMEEQGLSFAAAERELTPMEKLEKENDELKARLYNLENRTNIPAVTGQRGPAA